MTEKRRLEVLWLLGATDPNSDFAIEAKAKLVEGFAQRLGEEYECRVFQDLAETPGGNFHMRLDAVSNADVVVVFFDRPTIHTGFFISRAFECKKPTLFFGESIPDLFPIINLFRAARIPCIHDYAKSPVQLLDTFALFVDNFVSLHN